MNDAAERLMEVQVEAVIMRKALTVAAVQDCKGFPTPCGECVPCLAKNALESELGTEFMGAWRGMKKALEQVTVAINREPAVAELLGLSTVIGVRAALSVAGDTERQLKRGP